MWVCATFLPLHDRRGWAAFPQWAKTVSLPTRQRRARAAAETSTVGRFFVDPHGRPRRDAPTMTASAHVHIRWATRNVVTFNARHQAHCRVSGARWGRTGERPNLQPAMFAPARRRASGSSRLSHSAMKLASIMFSEQPTVLQRSSPRADSISTRGLAAVPRCSSTMRTL